MQVFFDPGKAGLVSNSFLGSVQVAYPNKSGVDTGSGRGRLLEGSSIWRVTDPSDRTSTRRTFLGRPKAFLGG